MECLDQEAARCVERNAHAVLRVVGRKDEDSARTKNAGELADSRGDVEEMLDHLHGEHTVEAAILERESFHVCLEELGSHAFAFDGLSGGIEDSLGDVAADQPCRPISGSRDRRQEAAVAATRVEQRLGGEGAPNKSRHAFELAIDAWVGERNRLRVPDFGALLVDLAKRVRRRIAAHQTILGGSLQLKPAWRQEIVDGFQAVAKPWLGRDNAQ